MLNNTLKPINANRSLLAEQVYNTIKSAILNGQIPSGERLKEVEVSKKLGVSRTPVREALYKLRKEGLLTNLAGGGVKVSQISTEEINKVFELRILLETYAVEKAVHNFTEEDIKKMEEILIENELLIERKNYKKIVELNTQFHDVIINASNNDKLFDILIGLRDYLALYRSISLSSMEGAKESFEAHKRIFENIKRKDNEAICQSMKEHLEEARRTILSRVSSKDD
ncbi:GntR family transcriptional regulator [Desulfitibacter alkalitolerans]|uniref:GntR family transcriptional regulator n=1 Tax=Desulfitibacter alkalitolerans TaxID=264641 RepID=UPI000489BD5B|nr:GntR family transcriptional regulator [Desulfitibacter alkalitolerans]